MYWSVLGKQLQKGGGDVPSMSVYCVIGTDRLLLGLKGIDCYLLGTFGLAVRFSERAL